MTVCSTLRCNQSHRDILTKAQVNQDLFPAIEFYPRGDGGTKATPEGKSESLREFAVPFDLSETDKTFKCYIKVFSGGTPEQHCSMRQKVEGLANKLGHANEEAGESEAEFKERSAKSMIGLYLAVLDGPSLKSFEERLNSAALNEKTHHKKFQDSINEVAKTTFRDWSKAYSTQKST